MSSLVRRIQRRRPGKGQFLGVTRPDAPAPNSLPARGSRRRLNKEKK